VYSGVLTWDLLEFFSKFCIICRNICWKYFRLFNISLAHFSYSIIWENLFARVNEITYYWISINVVLLLLLAFIILSNIIIQSIIPFFWELIPSEIQEFYLNAVCLSHLKYILVDLQSFQTHRLHLQKFQKIKIFVNIIFFTCGSHFEFEFTVTNALYINQVENLQCTFLKLICNKFNCYITCMLPIWGCIYES